jgi:C-terminal processing protease CtpA/Prc
LVDSLSERFGGNKNVKRKKAISSLLIRPIDQECTITAISESDTIVEKLKYNKSFKMPSNFNNRSYMFKQINKQTAYLRIPSWNLVNYLFFLNNKDTFEHLENVIIDLRGNSGGWECEAMRFASLFIDKPCVYSTISFPWDQSNVIKETSVVNSAPKSINLSKVSVFILINGRTACASETFCDFMRSNTDAILIGNEKSSGALSFGHKIKLPNNYFLTTTLSTSIETATQNVIEYQGIAPDVWVSLAEINDLAPYGDKVLKTALLMVSSTTKKTRFEL